MSWKQGLNGVFDKKNVNFSYILKIVMRYGQFAREKQVNLKRVRIKTKGSIEDKNQLLKIKGPFMKGMDWSYRIDTKNKEQRGRAHILIHALRQMGCNVDKSSAKIGYTIKHKATHKNSDIYSDKELQENCQEQVRRFLSGLNVWDSYAYAVSTKGLKIQDHCKGYF